MIRRAGCLSVCSLVAILATSGALAQDVAAPAPPKQSGDAPKSGFIKLEPKLDLNPPREEPQAEPRKSRFSLSGGVQEKDLAIEWDNWHNKLVEAVLPRVFNNFAEALNIPAGATTWIHCEVTSDRHIKTALITKSSGILWYDRMVRDAVFKLDGNYVLTFPAQSKRTEVATNVAIVKGGKRKGFINFGDVEYADVAPGETVGAQDGQQADMDKRASKSRSHSIFHR